MAKLLYAAPAWWAPPGLLHRYRRIAGFVRRSVRSGSCDAGLAEISTLVDEASEDKLFCILPTVARPTR